MSKFLSLDWFRSKIEKATENAVEKVVTNKLNELMEEETSPLIENPCINIKLIGDSLIVVLKDGTILNKSNATKEDFNSINSSNSLEEILEIISSKQVNAERGEERKKDEKIEQLIKGIELLKDLEDFVVKESSVYLKGIDRSMPQLLVEKFIEIIDGVSDELDYPWEIQAKLNQNDEYISLKKFWLKCCLNPNAQSAEDLYEFLSKHNFKIDKHGNFYAYRNVVSRNNENKELVQFISNAYTKIKAVWKKRASDFVVLEENGEYKLGKIDSKDDGQALSLGNLEELYKELPTLQENSYTSARTGQEDYRIGEVISMPRQRGDDNNSVSCSKGFHAASKEYDYSYFGDTSILVIINPMDVLAVPVGEIGKLRTCRWFFATTLSEDEKYILDEEDYDVSELGDIFEEKCNENLKDYVQNSFAEEIQRHTFNIPTLSNKQLKEIVNSLDRMKEVLDSRVNNI